MDIRKIFKYYFPHVRRYRTPTVLVFFSYALAVAGTGLVIPVLYKRIIDNISSGADPLSLSTSLIQTVFILGVVLVVANVFYRIADYAMAYSQSRMIKDISDEAFSKIECHSYEFFSSTFTGTLIAKVRRYIRAFEDIYDNIVFTVWMNGLNLLFGIIILSYFSTLLGVLFFIWLLLYVGLTAMFVKKKIQKDLLEAEANSRTTGVLSDAVTNMLNIKMFASQDREVAYFANTTDIEEKRRRDAWYFQNLQFLFQSSFIHLFEFIGMFSAVYLWIHGVISAGTVVLMQIYVISTFHIVWSLGRNFTRVMRAFAEAQEMVDIFEKPPTVQDPENPQQCAIEKGDVRMENISFSYGEERNDVFRGLSLHLFPGERVGIVGPSGAGKTTITKLLLRFADVQEGSIIIDGQDIRHITQNELRSLIAYVPQDPILFHRTLRENIAYAKPEASEEEILDVAMRSRSHEFIKLLPKGYDTYVGERGIKLSGGERQRVAIARAMLKNAPILILDEATSSLDSLSEKHIQEAFEEIMKGRTTLVIAHRLSTIQKMDRIIVFDNGVIREEGTHKELLEKKGLYYDLWRQQSHGFVGG